MLLMKYRGRESEALKSRLTVHIKKPYFICKKRFLIITTLTVCVLLSGWYVPIGSLIEFAFPAAIDISMVKDFDSIVDSGDLLASLNGDNIAEQIISGIQSNLAGNVYDLIELPEMQDEPIGVKIVKILLDRLFN